MLGAAAANGSPASGTRGRHVAELDHDRGRHRHPRVPLALGPDREREAAARAQDAAHLAQRRRRVALEHVAEAREDAVDARVVQLEPLGVEHAELDVREPELLAARRAASTMFGERSLEISRPASPEARGGEEARLARARGELEDRLPGLRVEPVDEPLADLAGRLLEQVAAPVPARGHLLPELVVRAPPRARGYSARSSASSSGEGSHSPAAAFARTCSGVVAPAITEATAGWAARPPIATSSRPQAAVAREGLERLDPVPRRVVDVEPLRREARALGRRLAAAVLAGEQAAREREVRQQAEPEPLARGDQVALGVAREPRVLVLRRDEPRRAARAAATSSASATCAAEKFE